MHKMTDDECIRDLETLKEVFEQENKGCAPLCLTYAIDRLKNLKKKSDGKQKGDTTCN